VRHWYDAALERRLRPATYPCLVGAAPSLTFEILGSLSIRRGDHLVSLRSPQQRKVLARLLVADRAVLPDELIDVLWGERPPATALGTLQTHVSRLRTALGAGPELLPSDASGYRLRIDSADVDARQFERLVAGGTEAARAGQSAEAQTLLADALALWPGPALMDFRYEPFAQTEITRLESPARRPAKAKAEQLFAGAADTAAELGMDAITRRLAESG
jgi:DNA-binding SARP family transcriptional activator